MPQARPSGSPIPFPEFVALIASLFALGALGIDAMLPALPAIGESLGVWDPNDRQFVIGVYLFGLGVAQLFHGPLADRFGRRRVLLWAIGVYAVANLLAAASGSFALLLASRAAAGASIAATRVAATAIVRDRFEGATMARVMSFAFTVFMIVPIIAPALGEAVLAVADWRAIFWVIAGLSVALFVWFWARMPETLAPEDRRPIRPRQVADGWARTARDRLSLGYALAAAAMMGGVYGYINSVQQIMADFFGRPDLLAPVFAATAGVMAVGNFANARLVTRIGTRRLSHGAVAALVALSAAHLLLVELGHESIATFTVLQALTLACLALSNANFSAMAMTNMGPIAGTAASVQGFAIVTFGSLMGAAVGQAFDGTPAPLAGGFLLAGLLTLALVAWTERGRLFGR